MGHRILIKGGSGSGKSTLGRALAHHIGVPYVELDALHHGPNWTAALAPELRRRILTAIDDHRGWVVDGTTRANSVRCWRSCRVDRLARLAAGNQASPTYAPYRFAMASKRGALERQPRDVQGRILGSRSTFSLGGKQPLSSSSSLARTPGGAPADSSNHGSRSRDLVLGLLLAVRTRVNRAARGLFGVVHPTYWR